MAMSFLLLLECVALFLGEGVQSLCAPLVAALSCVLCTFINNALEKALYQNRVERTAIFMQFFASAVQGIIIGFLVPTSINLFSLFFLTLFVMLIAKWLFGGYSESPTNVCALSVVMLYLLSSESFSITSGSDIHNLETLLNSGTFFVAPFDSAITGFLNRVIFSHFDTALPSGYITLFWDGGSSIPAFRYNLLSLLSLIILCISDNGRALTSNFFLGVYSILVFIFGDFINGGRLFCGDVLFALSTNGVFFTLAFVLCWAGSLPIKRRSRIILGTFFAIVVFFVTGVSLNPVGLALSVVISNFTSIFIQYLENKADFLRTTQMLNKEAVSATKD